MLLPLQNPSLPVGFEAERASIQPQAAPEPAPVVEASKPMKPVQRGTAQDAGILDAIRTAGLDPLALPKNKPGKPGIKANIRALLVGKHDAFPKEGKQFDKAWGRLRDRCELADAR